MRHLLPGRNPSEKNVALGLVPSLGSGRAGTPELVIRTLRLVPRMCQLRGVRKGNVARGLVPRQEPPITSLRRKPESRGMGNLVAPALVPCRRQPGLPPEPVIRMLRLVPSMCQLRGVGEGNVARGLVPRLGRGPAGVPNSSFVCCDCSQACANCGGVGEGNVARGLVPRLGRGRAGRPELVIRTLRMIPRMCQLRGCGRGECSAGACPPLGEGPGRPSGLVIRLRSKARPVPRYRAGIQGMGIGAANDRQTLPPTRRPHRRRDGFQTRPGRGWGTPTPAGYRSGSTTVRNGNR